MLALGTLAGYALGRLPMRGKFPTPGRAADDLGVPGDRGDRAAVPADARPPWLNSYQALILPYTAFNLPFAIWILRNYMLGIPKEMEETGRIDGASPLRTVWTIVLPQALPGLFTAGIFCFTACWTEFLMALTLQHRQQLPDDPGRDRPVRLPFRHVPYGTIFAASVVAVVPIGILVFVFRRFVVSGLTSGAVKG